MNSFLRTLLGLALLFSVNLTVQAQSADPKARAKQALAIRSAAQDVLAVLETLSESSSEQDARLTEPLASHMVEYLELFTQKKPGQNKAQEWLRAWRAEEFDRQLESIVQRNAEQSPLPFDAQTVLQRSAPDWKERRNNGSEKFAAQHINTLYPVARERAVQMQLSRWKESQSYPTQSELDPELIRIDQKRKHSATPLSADSFQSLDGWLGKWVQAPKPLFEELKHTQAEMMGSLRDEITRQYQGQLETLEPLLTQGNFPPDQLAAPEMEFRMLNQLLNSNPPNASSTPPAYAAFAAVISLVHDTAAQWEAERLRDHLKKQSAWHPSNQQLQTLLEADPKRYADPNHGLNRFTDHWAKSNRESMLTRYIQAIPEADQSVALDYFQTVLKKNEGTARVWKEEMRRVLETQLPPLRHALMENQYREHFQSLNLTEKNPENILVWFYDQGHKKADRIEHVIEAWKSAEVPRLTDLNPDSLIHETRNRVLKETNELLISDLSSLTRQLARVQTLDNEGRHELEQAVNDGSSFKDLLQQWTLDWNKGWEEERKQHPELAKAMYQRTRDQLDKTVRQLFKTVEQAAAAGTPAFASEDPDQLESDNPSSSEMTRVEVPNEKPGEQIEEQEKPQGAGAGAQEEAGMTDALRAYRGRADGVLSFKDLPSGGCRLVFGSPTGSGAISVEFDPENIDESAQAIATAMSGPLRQVLEGHKPNGMAGLRLFNRSSTPELRMLFRVDSSAIRHQMSIQIRDLIEDQIDAWATETQNIAPRLLWQDEAGR